MSIESWRAAWYMAQLGYPVFPLQDAGKRPRERSKEEKTVDDEGRGGFYVATTDPKTIIFWAETIPHANYGIACGNEAGVTVLDLDRHSVGQDGISLMNFFCKNQGGTSIEEWRKKTFVVETPSNGLHIYFQYFPGKARTLVSGIELQNKGRYVVGPGSQTRKGGYTSHFDAVSPEQLLKADSWLRKLVEGLYGDKTEIKTSTTKMNIECCINQFGCVPEGYRHDAVYMELIFMLGHDEMEQIDAFNSILEKIEESFEGENVFTANEIKRNMKNALRHMNIPHEAWLDEHE